MPQGCLNAAIRFFNYTPTTRFAKADPSDSTIRRYSKEVVADEPVSRILSAALILACARISRFTQRDDHSSRSRIAPGLKQPTRGSQQLALSSESHTGWASPPLLFGLAPRGVFRAPDVATRAVGSYPTFSPLPNEPSDSGEP
jgi:hypothetical protein